MTLAIFLGNVVYAQEKFSWDTSSTHYTNGANYAAYSGKVCNVTIDNRTFTADEWNGVCLPFDLTKIILDDTFGEGKYDLQLYTSIEGSTLTFKKMADDATIAAGTPFMLKTSETVADPVFRNVTITDDITEGFHKSDIPSAEGNIEFRGFYFNLYPYLLYDQDDNKTFYIIKSDGSITKEYQESYNGTLAYIFCNAGVTPSIVLEGSSGGNGGGEGGEEQSSLQQKIRNREQLTDVPTIYLDFANIPDNPTEEELANVLYKTVTNAIEDAPYSNAKIQVVATEDTTNPNYINPFTEEAEFLQVKVRGNSTAKTEKKPYRLKFAKKHKHDMLNSGYEMRNWTLLANAFDKSMIRNAVNYHLGKYVGMPFNPGYKFVDLVINNNYRGTYQVSDHIETDANRIDIDEDNGWYVEFQGRGDMLDTPNLSGYNLLINVKNPDIDGIETEEGKTAMLEEMADWFNTKWKTGFQTWSVGSIFDPDEGWRAFNDEETLMKLIIATEISGDYDGYMTVKAYRDTDTKLFWGPIWDKDLAFGNYGTHDKSLIKDVDNASSVRGYINDVIMKDPSFTKKLSETMDNLVANGLEDNMLADIDRLAGLVSKTKDLNYEKWGDKQLSMEAQYGKEYSEYITNIKNWTSARIKFVQDEFKKIAENNNASQGTFTYDTNKNEHDNNVYNHANKIYDINMINRTFEKGVWNTICVPFSLSTSQLKEIFGEGYELKEMKDISDDGKTLFFYTPEDNCIVAARPYFIKPAKEVTTIPVIKDAMVYNNNKNGKEVTLGNYTFKGHIYQGYLTDKILVNANSGDVTFTPTSNWESVNGSTAYFTISNGAEYPTICFEEPSTTTLNANITETENKNVLNEHIGKVVNVQLKNRTFGESYWNTLTLPFDVSAAQMAELFGEGYDLEEYTSMSDKTLHFTTSKTIEAGKPYLLKPVAMTVEPTFKKVTLKEVKNGEPVTHDSYSFCPALFPTTLKSDKTEIFLSTDGKLYYPAENYTLYGTRAYFRFPVGGSAKLGFTDDTITSICIDGITADATSADGTNNKVYNLNGQLIGMSADALPKGIYIVNGKKVVIK